MEIIIQQLISVLIGTAGFCLVFRVRHKLIPLAIAGSLLCWIVYLAGIHFADGIFVQSIIASTISAIYAKQAAKLLKAPATIFFITAMLPLIPGGSLYYTMSYTVQREWVMAKQFGYQTIQYALGIAIGMSFVWAFYEMKKRIHEQKQTSPPRTP
ncbi:MAG: threonine/serine exporter family protein [Lachnospiraceae bacterium]|nr:threonine/serine exporter family protein [Lachnospiraceae bacterium]